MQSRFDARQVRYIGTSGLALMLRSRVLLLETKGRKSGRRRRTTVVYWEDGGKIFIGGGAAGMTRVDWVANVRSNPQAVAWVRRRRLSVLVRELSGDEYETARVQAFERWPKARKYEARSGRRIPYFRLDTTDG